MRRKQHAAIQLLIVSVFLAAMLIAVLRGIASTGLLLMLGANMTLIIKHYFTAS